MAESYYQLSELWGNLPASYQRRVQEDLLNIIPADAQTMLDLGCGDGFIANTMADRKLVVGVDISATALKFVRSRKCLGTITGIPFQDNSFDAVMANDVIEHLNEADYILALSEVARVADKYIIITVPFLENLKRGTAHCENCGDLFHINFHFRNFDFQKLSDLFNGRFQLRSIAFSGVEWDGEMDIVYEKMHKDGIFNKGATSICPKCGHKQQHADENSMVVQALEGVRTIQARNLIADPDIQDYLQMRSEAICLFTKGIDAIDNGIKLKSIDIDDVKKDISSKSRIDFAFHSRYRKEFLPIVSNSPYFVAQNSYQVCDTGIRPEIGKNKDRRIKFGFFVGKHNAGSLHISGISDGRCTIQVIYFINLTVGYFPLITKVVSGPFQIDAPISYVPVSQYGYLFEIVASAALELHDIAIETDRDFAISYTSNTHPYIRRSTGSIDLYLGKDPAYEALIPAWFKTCEYISSLPSSGNGVSEATLDSWLQTQKSTILAHSLDSNIFPNTGGRKISRKIVESICKDLISSKIEHSKIKEQKTKLEEFLAGLATLKLRTKKYEAAKMEGRKSQHAARPASRISKRPLFTAARLRRVTSILKRFMTRCFRFGAKIRKESTSVRTVTMLVPDDRIDRRVLLEARTLFRRGWEVTVIAAAAPEGYMLDEESFPEIKIIRIDQDAKVSIPTEFQYPNDALPGGQDWKDFYYYHNHFYLLAAKEKASIFVAHDLPVLPAALLAARRFGAKVIYDSHELYAEQNHFSSDIHAMYSAAERSLAKLPDLILTVNTSIANEMVDRYRIEPPSIILNSPDLGNRVLPIAKNRELLAAPLGIPQGKDILIFQGSLSINRNLENLVNSMALVKNENVVLVIMGPGDEMRKKLEAEAGNLGILGNRIYFHRAVPQVELLDYTAAADVGIIPYPQIDLNSLFCTPNKLFEFMVAGIPILANDSPELEKFVKFQSIGINHPMGSPAEIAEGIDRIFSSDLQGMRRNLSLISSRFAWAEQEEDLVKHFDKVLATHMNVSPGHS